MKVVFMGTPEFAVPPLEQLLLNEFQVVAVYTQPDKAAGRGRSQVSSPVKRLALDCQLIVVQPPNFKEEATIARLASWRPDIMVVAAFGQLLPQAVLDIPRYGCINIHPSLLPAFRGPSPVAAAILAGNEFTGVSVMLMDNKLDTGPVLGRAQVPISPRDTTGSLSAKLSRIGAQLLLDVLPRWLRGENIPKAQDEALATYSHALTKSDGEIDWQISAAEIWRRVRAFQPWPACYTRWQGKQLKIKQAVPLPGESDVQIGQVIALSRKDAVFGVKTADAILGILEVQLEGKQAMSAAEFARGQRQFIGTVLPSV